MVVGLPAEGLARVDLLIGVHSPHAERWHQARAAVSIRSVSNHLCAMIEE
jgi:hypothetical protein